VPVPVGDLVVQQVLLSRQDSAGKLAANHEHVRRLEPRLLPLSALIPVLLLVGAVELQDLFRILGEVGGGIVRYLGGERTPQPGAVGLYPLALAQYRLVDDRTHCSPLRIGYRAPTGRRCLVFWPVALIPDRSFGADEEPRPGRLHDRDL